MHTIEKALKDVGDRISDAEKQAASDAVTALKTAMGGDDREEIERKTQVLEQASAAILQKTYEQQQAAGGAAAHEAGAEAKKDDVLDAEFEEVKESDRKKA